MGRVGMALGLAGVLSGAYLAWCPVKDWRSQNNDLTEAFSSGASDSIVNVLHYAYKKLRASRTCLSLSERTAVERVELRPAGLFENCCSKLSNIMKV